MVTQLRGRKLDGEAVGSLKSRVRGPIVQPGDESYDADRAVYNGMIDRHPSLIVRCTDAGDVMATVDFAREHGLPLSIRGGGHSAAGLGVLDDGVVVDLSLMRGVRVDPESRTARVQAGSTWAEVDHATHAFGLATPSGFFSSTGVGGLTLGGGHGYLTRQYGLTIDNLLEVDVVLADGSFVTANASQNADLFWAVRGGGGNFGVVTSFLFQLHPVSTIIGGPTLWEIDKTPEVLAFYRDFIKDAPEELSGWFGLMTVPPAPPFPEALQMKKVCGVVWCYTGSEEQAAELFRPVQEFGPPDLYLIHPMPYPMLQRAFDALYPPGLQWYWKADFVTELSEASIEEHYQQGLKMPTPHSTIHLYPIDGAAHQVGPDDTAFSYREANFSEIFAGVDPDPANAGLIREWARSAQEALHPYSSGGAYVNFMMDDEGQDRVRATYRDNYDRLAEVKMRYDPDNLFRINQNVKPKS